MHWKDYGTRLSVKTFAWATGAAYAAQYVEHNGKFYWFAATFQRSVVLTAKAGNRGVVVAARPVSGCQRQAADIE